MSTITDELLLRLAVVGGAVAAAEVAAFDDRIAAAGDSAAATGKKVSGLGNVFMSFKALIAGFTIVDAVKQFSSFQAQMEMLKTQTGATQGEVTRATKAVLGMATAVGTGPNSLAQALYHIESTQVRGVKAYQELRIAAEGARVGNANLVDVTNALNATLVGKLIPATGGFSAAMGQLNATVGAGDMTMQNLASGYSTGILSALKAVGLQLIDVNAAMAVLGDNNMRGTQAANRLRMGLLQVVKPTSEAAAALHGLNMGTYSLAQDYYKPNGLYVMLEDLHKHLDKLSKIQQNDVLMTLFGRGRMSSGIMTLYTEMDRLQNKYEAIGKGASDFNQEWAATKQTFAFTIDQVKALAEVWLIKVGHEVQNVVVWFRKMGPVAQSIRDIAIAVAIMTAGWKLAEGAVIAFNLIADANPWFLALTGIAAIIVALIAKMGGLKKAAKDVGEFFVHTWANIQSAVINAVNKVIGAINTLIRGYDSLVGKIPGFGNSLKVGQIGYVQPGGGGANQLVETSPGHYVPLYKLEQPGTAPGLHPPGSSGITPSGADMAPGITPSGADMAPAARYAVMELDGKVLAKGVLKQGLQATARRGAGGPTISQTG